MPNLGPCRRCKVGTMVAVVVLRAMVNAQDMNCHIGVRNSLDATNLWRWCLERLHRLFDFFFVQSRWVLFALSISLALTPIACRLASTLRQWTASLRQSTAISLGSLVCGRRRFGSMASASVAIFAFRVWLWDLSQDHIGSSVCGPGGVACHQPNAGPLESLE